MEEEQEKIPKKDREFKVKEENEESSYDELLEFARETEEEFSADEETEIEDEKNRVIEWEESGDRESRERNELRMLGYMEYQLTKNPEIRKKLEEIKAAGSPFLSIEKRVDSKEVEEEMIEGWNKSGFEKIDSKSENPYFKTLRVSLNRCLSRYDTVLETFGTINPSGISTPRALETKEYAPKIIEGTNKLAERVNREDITEEEKEENLERIRNKIKIHLGSFGKAALEAEDLIPAIDCLNYSGDLKSQEIVSKLKERMEELKKSGKPEDREILIEASKKLIEISKREKEE